MFNHGGKSVLSAIGWESYKFKKKLKFVKEKLQIWNREAFGGIRIRKRDILQDLEA